MAVADRAALCRPFGKVDAVKQVPQPIAIGAAPGVARLARATIAELADVVDPVQREPPLHLRTDSGNLAQRVSVERVRQGAVLEPERGVGHRLQDGSQGRFPPRPMRARGRRPCSAYC